MKPKLHRLILLLMAAVLMSGPAPGATIYSVRDGMWMDPATWGGGLPDVSADSIVIGHIVTIAENIALENTARLTVLGAGQLQELGNRTLKLATGTALYNNGEITIFKIDNSGTIYNTGLIDLEGDLINHFATIYNDGMIYAKNLLTQGGMLSGDGGQYMIWNNLNSTAETIGTCTSEPVNICNPDGVTDPCNGQGYFDPECVTICGLLLDLELTCFEASANDATASIQLTWTTFRETGLLYFVVERATEQMGNWAPISPEIPSEGNLKEETHTYRYLDIRPAYGINLYRLASYAQDGTMARSYVVSARSDVSTVIGIYPNPFKDQLCLQGYREGYDRMELIGSTGQVLLVRTGDLTNCLQLGELEDGWYLVRLSGPQGQVIFPVLKIQPAVQTVF